MKRILFNVWCACLMLAASAAIVSAQAANGAPTPAPQDGDRTTAPTNVNEDFELNITERRITENSFEAATEIRTGDVRGLDVRVGVLARAGEINVLLRNVRGHVRFRATLDPVLRLLRLAGTLPPAPPPDPSSP